MADGGLGAVFGIFAGAYALVFGWNLVRRVVGGSL